jgi:hypothetical protein
MNNDMAKAWRTSRGTGSRRPSTPAVAIGPPALVRGIVAVGADDAAAEDDVLRRGSGRKPVEDPAGALDAAVGAGDTAHHARVERTFPDLERRFGLCALFIGTPVKLDGFRLERRGNARIAPW